MGVLGALVMKHFSVLYEMKQYKIDKIDVYFWTDSCRTTLISLHLKFPCGSFLPFCLQ